MKRLVILFSILISNTAFCQSNDYAVMPIQVGSAKLAGGKTTISLDQNTLSALSPKNGGEAYYVELTPIGKCGALKLNEKGESSFTVAAIGSGPDASFDYIVFLKYHLISINDIGKPTYILPATGTTK
ncbi:MAG TPA: hypothetical protein VNZ45_08525 [Bacteroidia bacterium]|jgi:hypothetical protein|nr:hypothetical protein [Bacteroidia bacterium]